VRSLQLARQRRRERGAPPAAAGAEPGSPSAAGSPSAGDAGRMASPPPPGGAPPPLVPLQPPPPPGPPPGAAGAAAAPAPAPAGAAPRDRDRERPTPPPAAPADDAGDGDANAVCAEPKLFLGGLRYDVSADDVRAYYAARYGPLRSVVLLTHHDTGKSKGCALVLCESWAGAEAAVAAEHGAVSPLTQPRPAVVKLADPQRNEHGVFSGITPKKLFVGQVRPLALGRAGGEAGAAPVACAPNPGVAFARPLCARADARPGSPRLPRPPFTGPA
jgi:hypothetical protein